jgi:hypothetical protein
MAADLAGFVIRQSVGCFGETDETAAETNFCTGAILTADGDMTM